MKEKKGRRLHATFVISVILLIISGLLLFAARMVSGFAQWYTVTIYPVLVVTLGRFSGTMPVSLAEMLCAAIMLLLAADIALRIIRTCRSHSGAAGELLRFLRHVFLLISVLLFLYSANCGVNYYRDPFVDPSIYADAVFTEEELVSFCEYTADHLREIYDTYEDSTSIPPYPEGKKLSDTAVDSMHDLSVEYPGLTGYYPRPKQLAFMSRMFSNMGVSGVYSPFTIEANVNGEMEGMEKPFTSCHELSHLRGYMNEGEANYIGWLACIGSKDLSFRRSGWLIAWIYAGNSLRRTDPELYASMYKQLPEEAIHEIEANNAFWAEHETKASEVQDRVNDAYLKSNGQEEGVRTYGRLTTLMLLWYRNIQ